MKAKLEEGYLVSINMDYQGNYVVLALEYEA